MKKRNVRRDDSPPLKPAKIQQQKKEKRSKSWKKIIILLLAAAAMLGFSVAILPELLQQFAFMYRIRLPFFVDLSQPADFSLNHTVNMYLTSEEGISLGVWWVKGSLFQLQTQQTVTLCAASHLQLLKVYLMFEQSVLY